MSKSDMYKTEVQAYSLYGEMETIVSQIPGLERKAKTITYPLKYFKDFSFSGSIDLQSFRKNVKKKWLNLF